MEVISRTRVATVDHKTVDGQERIESIREVVKQLQQNPKNDGFVVTVLYRLGGQDNPDYKTGGAKYSKRKSPNPQDAQYADVYIVQYKRKKAN